MISIVDYDVCNLASIENMLKQINFKAKITKNPEEIFRSKLIILPGVGSFDEGMKNLKKNNLDKVIIEFNKQKKNILGICLGMQLFASESEEFGYSKGLGIIKGKIKFLKNLNCKNKVPHIGWNSIRIKKKHPFLDKVENDTDFYFVNSYVFLPEEEKLIIAETKYDIEFCSVIAKENVFSTKMSIVFEIQ